MTKYEVQLRFISASHVPVGDFFNGSSDPYVKAYINHKSDNEIQFRTSTCRSTRDPEWQKEDVWHIGGVEEGTLVKLRLFDEDPRKMSNDRIGALDFKLDNLEQIASKSDGEERDLTIRKRKAVKVYVLTYTYSWLGAQDLRKQHATIKVGIKVKRDEKNRPRPCLIGPIRYDIHFSPLLGRLASTKDSTTKVACFLGYVMHLRDVPDCRFPFTKKRKQIVMMYSNGIRGALIRRAFRSQHATIYGFDSRTIVGSAKPHDAAARFLEMTDAGSMTDKKMFTYAITPDGTFHFTRTGEQFAINNISKHAMHSNAAREVVYSGEFFFVKRDQGEHGEEEIKNAETAQTIIKDDSLVLDIRRGTQNIKNIQHGNTEQDKHLRARDKAKIKLKAKMNRNSEKEDQNEKDVEASKRHFKVSDFTLVFDNSSGTFMPDAKDLPKLEKFLESNFPGLRIKGLAQDDPKLKEAKESRRLDDNDTVYGQGSMSGSSSSSSSSNLSNIDPTEQHHRHPEFHTRA